MLGLGWWLPGVVSGDGGFSIPIPMRSHDPRSMRLAEVVIQIKQACRNSHYLNFLHGIHAVLSCPALCSSESCTIRIAMVGVLRNGIRQQVIGGKPIVWLDCPFCHKQLGQPRRFVELVRGMDAVNCSCGQTANMNWWNIAVHLLEDSFSPWRIVDMLGPEITPSQLELHPYEERTLDFDTLGIPADAMVISVNYTSQGGAEEFATLFPLEHHFNEVPDPWYNIRKRRLLPVTLSMKPPSTTNIAVAIRWFAKERGPADLVRDAFCRFVRHEFEQAVVLACTGLESELTEYLSPVVGSYTAKHMSLDLKFGAFETVSLGQGILSFPKHLLDPVKFLKKLRNQVAHSGRFNSTVTRKQMSEVLVASAFFLQHLRDAYNSSIRWCLADGTVVELGGEVIGTSIVAEALRRDAFLAYRGHRISSHYGLNPGSERLDLVVPHLVDSWVRYSADCFDTAIVDAPNVQYP